MASASYKIELHNELMTFEERGLKILVDTGSPVTLCRAGTFFFLGRKHCGQRSLLGADIDELSRLAGFDFDVLLGMDLLGGCVLDADRGKGTMSFSDDDDAPAPQAEDGFVPVPVTVVGGFAVVARMTVAGTARTLIIDSGAHVSYLERAAMNGWKCTGRRDDFYPQLGRFSTDVFSADVQLAGTTFPVEFGILPNALALMLPLLGADGIIGADLFENFRVVADFRRRTLSVRPYATA